MTFPFHFFVISSWFESQSAPGLFLFFFWTIYSFSVFGCKQYNQSDFGVNHLVMSMCTVFSCVVGKWCLLWPVCSLDRTLLAFSLLHFVLQAQTCLLLWVSLDFLLLHYSSLWWKGHLFLVLVLEGLELFDFSFLSISGWGIGLDYCDVECLPWKRTKIIPSFLRLFRYCILDSFVDCEGCSISFKRFLPTE